MIYRVPNRCPISHIDKPIDISLISDLPYRYLISIFKIGIGSYLVTLPGRYCPPRHTILPTTSWARMLNPLALRQLVS